MPTDINPERKAAMQRADQAGFRDPGEHLLAQEIFLAGIRWERERLRAVAEKIESQPDHDLEELGAGLYNALHTKT